MKRIVNSLLVLAILAGVTACSGSADTQNESDTPTWQEQYDLGVRYLSEGHYEEAIIAFTAAIEIDPKQALAYVGRGDAYVQSGETEENLVAAQADYEKAIELDEASVDAYLGLADVYIRLGDSERALEIIKQGIDRTGDGRLQIFFDELSERYQNNTQDLITVAGSIFMGEFDETYQKYCEEYDFRVGMRTYGIKFETPINIQIDGQSITIQEAEADNLFEHFDEESQLYNYSTQTAGMMIGRRMSLTGYVYQRDPAGELTHIEEGDNSEMVDYIYHPYGEYAFYLVSYKLLD